MLCSDSGSYVNDQLADQYMPDDTVFHFITNYRGLNWLIIKQVMLYYYCFIFNEEPVILKCKLSEAYLLVFN